MAETGGLIPGRWRIGEPPPGPVEIWFAVFTGDGVLMGAERAARTPQWLWRDGTLALSYAPLTVRVTRPGHFSTGLICAADPRTGIFRPLWPVSLGEPQELEAGNNIIVADGVIAIHPELPGPHG